MTQKQSDLFYTGGAGAIAVPQLEGVYQEKNITSATTIGGTQALYDSFTVSADGKYKAGFDLSIANPGFLTSASRFVQFQLRKNGVLASTDAVATCQLINHPSAGQDYASTSCTTILDLAAGDTIEIWASSATTGAISVHSGNLYIVPVGQGDQLVGNATNDFLPKVGVTDGVAIPTGEVGEYLEDVLVSSHSVVDFTNETQLTDLSLALDAGVWMVGYNLTTFHANASGGQVTGLGFKLKYNSVYIQNSAGFASFRGSDGVPYHYGNPNNIAILNTTVAANLDLYYEAGVGGTPTLRIEGESISGSVGQPDNSSKVWALRIR